MRYVDHINKDPHDNSIDNLQIGTELHCCKCGQGFPLNSLLGEHFEKEHPTLEPCVCGRAAECVSGPNLCQVVCRNRGRRGPVAESEWLAVNLWNNDRRTEPKGEW